MPAANELIRKKTGSIIDDQSGCRRGDMMMNIVPNEDWCIVESVTPAITIGTVKRLIVGSSHLKRVFSKNTGLNS